MWLISLKKSYSVYRFSFREKKTEKAIILGLAKIKPNENKTGKEHFKNIVMWFNV